MTAPKRPAHRPLSTDKATKLATMKLTPAQHAKFLEMGGSRWVKRLLNEALNTPPSTHQSLPHHGRLPMG